MVDFCVVLITLLHGLLMMNVYSKMCVIKYYLHMINLTNIEGNIEGNRLSPILQCVAVLSFVKTSFTLVSIIIIIQNVINNEVFLYTAFD